MSLLSIPDYIQLALFVAIFVVQVFALVDAVTHRPDAYVAGDKLTKQTWLIILGIGLLANVLLGHMLITMAALVAALVYLVDVRPTLRSLTRR